MEDFFYAKVQVAHTCQANYNHGNDLGCIRNNDDRPSSSWIFKSPHLMHWQQDASLSSNAYTHDLLYIQKL